MERYTISLVFVVALLGAGVAVGVGVETASAQPTEEFNKTFGGADSDETDSVIETSDGGFALAGTTQSFGSGGDDAWLIKTDANGNVEINETFGGEDFDGANSVVQTSDGGFALAGSTESFGSGSGDAWLIKTDANGNEQFNETYGGNSSDSVSSVIETSDGNFALAGSTESFGSGPDDAWLIKTDPSGGVEFRETYGGVDSDSASSVAETSDGGLALAGRTESFGAGDDDGWLIKTDGDGNEQFNKTYGGADFDGAFSVAETSDDGFALAGTTESFGAGFDDAWLIKTDENGNTEINETFGGNSSDRAFSVVETSDGGFALAGETSSFGPIDAWFIKTDEDGVEQFNRTFGGRDTGGEPPSDSVESVIETPDGGFALAGRTESFGSGRDDAWLINLRGSSTSPVEGVSDELWNAVTADDGEDGLSLADLGNAIQEYQKNPSDADVDGASITLADLGSLIQYYRTEVV